MSFEEKIKDFVVENFLFGDAEDINNDDSFLEKGIVDSTGVLEIVAFIEDNFNITVRDDELIPENLDSINNLIKYIQGKNITREGIN